MIEKIQLMIALQKNNNIITRRKIKSEETRAKNKANKIDREQSGINSHYAGQLREIYNNIKLRQ